MFKNIDPKKLNLLHETHASQVEEQIQILDEATQRQKGKMKGSSRAKKKTPKPLKVNVETDKTMQMI